MENTDRVQVKSKKGIGFRYAWKGITHLIRTQRNARIHLAIAAIVIIAGYLLDISTTEWLIVTVCTGMVFSAEIFNTAVEYLTDLVSPGYNKTAGTVKDLAAGAVLVAALAAAGAGLIIFAPKIWIIVCTWSGNC